MEKYRCAVCSCIIPKARVAFLKECCTDPRDMCCIAHAKNARVKGIYSGEFGTSPIIFCDKIYNDSVRQKFSEAEQEVEEGDEDNLN